jgi:hypothetical protein
MHLWKGFWRSVHGRYGLEAYEIVKIIYKTQGVEYVDM